MDTGFKDAPDLTKPVVDFFKRLFGGKVIEQPTKQEEKNPTKQP